MRKILNIAFAALVLGAVASLPLSAGVTGQLRQHDHSTAAKGGTTLAPVTLTIPSGTTCPTCTFTGTATNSGTISGGTVNATTLQIGGLNVAGVYATAQQTASSSASISFTLNTSFKNHFIVFENSVPSNAGGAALHCRVGDGGGDKTSSYQWVNVGTGSNATALGANSTSDSVLKVHGFTGSATHGSTGIIQIGDVAATGQWKSIRWDLSGVLATGNEQGRLSGAGAWTGGTGALTTFKCFYSTGNMASGVWTYIAN